MRVRCAGGAREKAPPPPRAAPGGGAPQKPRRRPPPPGSLPPSTIGAGGLHFRVRNGNGCFPAALTTGNLVRTYAFGCQPPVECCRANTNTKEKNPKPSAD